MRKWLIRTGVILFWTLLIFGALYWPKWELVHFEPRSINIFAWGDVLEPSVIAAFEKESGVKVYLNYYSSNEELIVKLKATHGEGYDLIVPSDYAVSLLAKDGLLKEIDKSKLTFLNEINPLLLNHQYDPENRFSIPFEWEIFGLGIDTSFFEEHPLNPSWKAVFDKDEIYYKITMINDPVQTLQIAASYLFKNVEKLEKPELEAVKKLLLTQKNWVEAYADFRGDYFLATKNCPLVVATSSYILRSMKKFNFINFVVPDEGTFVSIENLSIPVASQKADLVYQFMNYLMREEAVKKHFNTYGFFPAVLHSQFLASLDAKTRHLIESSPGHFKNYQFTKVLAPYHEIQNLWVELKTQNE
jgi:spermidine/putrescine transport system substrate-binding protein